MTQGANMNRDNPSMSQTDFFSERTTLYTPAWYSDKTREERELPLSPADYKVVDFHPEVTHLAV